MIGSQHDREWFTSSYSGANNNTCVEVRFPPESIDIRDSKDRVAGYLRFGSHRWSAFLRTLTG